MTMRALLVCCLTIASVVVAEVSGVEAKNVLGDDLAMCSQDPMTGWERSGLCKTNEADQGTHVVCAQMTDEFLQFTKTKGNDLITPMPAYQFPGLKAGDRWCLCALRWREAEKAGKAPSLDLAATDTKALEYVPLATLQAHSLE